MTRHAARVDTTHAAVRDGLRALGWSVIDTSAAGIEALPDLIVGIGASRLPFPPDSLARGAICTGEVYMIEVKSPKGRLSTGQQEFTWEWRGNYIVAETAEEAAVAIQALRRGRDGRR